MRRAAPRLWAAAASSSRSVVVQPTASALATEAPRRSGVAVRAGEAMAQRTEAVAGRVFAGSSDRLSYSADTPILGEHFGPKRSMPPRPSAVEVRPAPPVPEPSKSLAQLERMPAPELKRMLAVRGVNMGAATEKAELAKWVHQHQDLPVLRRDANPEDAVRTTSPSANDSYSLSELREMSAKELREVLRVRGVGDGPATEKSELVQWVYQHQHLPVLRGSDPRRRQGASGGRRWGLGGESEPYDLPRKPGQHEGPKQEQIEGEDVKKLEGDAETKLLEGVSEEEEVRQTASSWGPLFWIPVGVAGALVAALGTFAYLDSQRSAADASFSDKARSPRTEHR